MPHCPDLLTIQSYVDGELAFHDAEGVHRHLQTCAECAQLAERLRMTVALLRHAPAPDAPADLLRCIEAAVARCSGGIDCDTARKLVHADLDAELEPGARPLLDAHIAECADCRHYHQRTRLTVLALRAAPQIAPPAGLRKAVEDAVRRAPRSLRPFRRSLINTGGLAAAAAILIVALMSVQGILLTGSPPQHPGSELVATGPTVGDDKVPTQSHQQMPIALVPEADAGPDAEAAPTTAPTEAATDPVAVVTDAAPPVTRTRQKVSVAARTREGAAARTVSRQPQPPPTAATPTRAVAPAVGTVETVLAVSPLVGIEPVSVAPDRGRSNPPLPKKSPVAGAPLSGTPADVTVTRRPSTSLESAPRPTLAKATPTTPVSLRAEVAPAHAPVGRRLPTLDETSSRSVHRSTPSPERLALAEERIDRQLRVSTVASEIPATW